MIIRTMRMTMASFLSVAKKVHCDYNCPALSDRIPEEYMLIVRITMIMRRRKTMTSSLLSWPRKSTVSTAVPSSSVVENWKKI